MTAFTRRQFIASAALAMPWVHAQAQSGTRLRCFWWGNPDRDKRTRAALETYAKKHNLQIAAESMGWGDYWTKLGTQVAGGNPPDLIQMDYRYLFEYARRNTLLPLDKLLPLPDFSKNDLEGGKVDGKLYGVNLGSNSKAMQYDVEMLKKVGVASIPIDWTWDDHARIAGEISKINPGKYWGSSDNMRWEQSFEQWLHSRGKPLYTAEGKAGFTPDDVAAWFDHWDKLRKAGVVPTPDVAASNNSKIEEYELTRGLTAMSFANSNQLVAFQGLNKNKLAIHVFPRVKGGTSGHYIKPAMMMSVSSKTKTPEEAARVINYMVTDPEGVKILGIERGVPCSAAARALLLPEADDLGKLQIDYVAQVTKIAVPLPPPPPKGAGEIENLLKRVADSVAFGKTSIKDGASQFHTEAVNTLARA
ncbi:MAG TPA: extracellular solute-binding protein [Casimicrobiaceae bacterium]|nr:extracellular solute-binding protein [Casimicrobiaceae bacterium]